MATHRVRQQGVVVAAVCRPDLEVRRVDFDDDASDVGHAVASGVGERDLLHRSGEDGARGFAANEDVVDGNALDGAEQDAAVVVRRDFETLAVRAVSGS